MNPNWVEMIKQLQQNRPGMGQPWGGGTAFAGGSPTFRETGRAIPPGPIPMGGQLGSAFGGQMPPTNVPPMPLPMPQQDRGWGQPAPQSPWGSGGPMQIGGAPQGPSMPSQPAMQGALGQVLGSMGQAQPGAIGRMMPQMQGGFTPPPMQGARSLSQIMASQQPVSPWGSGGPMRSRSTY